MSEVDKVKSSTILDIGVGFGIWGYLMYMLRKPKLLIGIDIDLNYLLTLRKHNIYDCLIRASASTLPFKERVFDYVLSIEVIEHLNKVSGEKMIIELERVCKRKIVVTTPNGYLEQHPYIATESEIHRSGWSAQEFKQKGYKVHGIGLRGTSFLRSRRSLTLYGMLNHLSVPLTFLFPEVSEYLFAVKKVGKDLDEC